MEMPQENIEKQTQTSEELKKPRTPEEELDLLRQKVAKKEAELSKESLDREKEEEIAKEKIQEYKNEPASEVIEEDVQMDEKEIEDYTLKLTPKAHDEKVREFLGMLEEKGIYNTLSIIEKMEDTYLEDDLHRVLVQIIKSGHSIKGLKERAELWRSLRMILYEIYLPEEDKDKKDKSFKELVSSMEQFYAGMTSIKGDKSGKEYFTFEIAVSEKDNDIILYCAVPDDKKSIFKKQLLSIFPEAIINEQRDDYNIFVENGTCVGSRAKFEKKSVFPIKTYENFDYNPLNIILNSLSKIEKDGEGAAIQFVIDPGDQGILEKYKTALKDLQRGKSEKDALNVPITASKSVTKTTKDIFKEVAAGFDKKDEGQGETNQETIEAVKEKISAQIMRMNLRIVASAQTKERAEAILREIESSFNQFENVSGNSINFETMEKKGLKKLERDFIFRKFNKKEILPLNIKEIISLVHIPSGGISSTSLFKQLSFKTAPAPKDIKEEGILLGVNNYQGQETKINLSEEDRLRHFYTIGQTGTGKTTLLKNMINQDIKNGEGLCMIDPHGADVEDILKNIPQERCEDVIYFDPAYMEKSMGLNMFEYNPDYPEQKTFVVNEIFNIFQKLYANVPESMGPMFEQYFRNAAALILEDPESGSTLLDISRVLSDDAFREFKLSKSNNPIVNQFWQGIATQTTGESQLSNIVPYITSKTDVFAANDIMRPIIGQQKSSFDFKNIMDEKKILLVNLSKGRLGELNSHLLGLIVVGKILMAALSRTNAPNNYSPFYLYIDEFQNVTTSSITTILSEARKYQLSLNIAHQFIAQLNDDIRDAVFGNVGSMAAFRVGSEDAEFLEKKLEPTFTAKDLISIENRNAIVSMLVDGQPTKPFNIETMAPEKGDDLQVEKLKQLSYLKYGRDRDIVESEIRKKYQI